MLNLWEEKKKIDQMQMKYNNKEGKIEQSQKKKKK